MTLSVYYVKYNQFHADTKATAIPQLEELYSSGLDKDLDQWVFHPLRLNLMSILLYI